MGNAVNHTAHSPSHLQTGEDLPVSAQGAQAPATLCASQTADVMAPAPGVGAGWGYNICKCLSSVIGSTSSVVNTMFKHPSPVCFMYLPFSFTAA